LRVLVAIILMLILASMVSVVLATTHIVVKSTIIVKPILRSTVIVKPNEVKEIAFLPLNISRRYSFIILCASNKPVKVIFIDEEQYWELDGRTDLYGYIYYKEHETLNIILWEVPTATPMWKYYIILENTGEAPIKVKISAFYMGFSD